MAEYVGLALRGEGNTDYRFLEQVLIRTTEELCSSATKQVFIGESVRELRPDKNVPGNERHRTSQVVKRDTNQEFIVFIHADGGSDWEKKYNEHVQALEQELGSRPEQIVGVVPVREMEAWTLVDGDTLRKAFKTNLKDEELGLSASSPARVENISDPKKELNNAYEKVLGPRVIQRRGKKPTAADFLTEIGREVPLTKLRQVPSFQRFEADLRKALVARGILE